MLGEPLHELYGSARKLWQVLDDVEVERVVGVYVHSGQCLVVVERLLKVGKQRLVIVASLLAVLRLVGLGHLHVVVDNVQLF